MEVWNLSHLLCYSCIYWIFHYKEEAKRRLTRSLSFITARALVCALDSFDADNMVLRCFLRFCLSHPSSRIHSYQRAWTVHSLFQHLPWPIPKQTRIYWGGSLNNRLCVFDEYTLLFIDPNVCVYWSYLFMPAAAIHRPVVRPGLKTTKNRLSLDCPPTLSLRLWRKSWRSSGSWPDPTSTTTCMPR